MTRDPVCGIAVDPDKSNWVVEYVGEEYYFCSESCQKAFVKDLEKYAEIRSMGQSHAGHGGRVGGYGAGMGRGWLSYVYIAIMIFLTLLLLFR